MNATRAVTSPRRSHAAQHAVLGRRASNAATAHADRRTKRRRTRAAVKNAAINEQR